MMMEIMTLVEQVLVLEQQVVEKETFHLVSKKEVVFLLDHCLSSMGKALKKLRVLNLGDWTVPGNELSGKHFARKRIVRENFSGDVLPGKIPTEFNYARV